MSPDDPPSKGLSVTASAVIIYILGGAHIAPNGAILGSSVVFDRPWIIKVAAIALLAYYGLRYNVSCARKLFSKSTDAIQNNMVESKSLRAHIDEVGRARATCLSVDDKLRLGLHEYQIKKLTGTTEWIAGRRPPVQGIFSLRPIAYVCLVSAVGGAVGEPFQVRLSAWRAALEQLRSGWHVSANNDVVWKELTPVLLFFFAVVLILAEWFWRPFGAQ